MSRILLTLFLWAFLLVTNSVLSAPLEAGIKRPEQLVLPFQEIPPYEFLCIDEIRGSAKPDKVGAKFTTYLSKEFYKLFLWTQCGEPEIPPRYDGQLDNMFYWDIRFGNDGESSKPKATNIRLNPTKYQGSDKAIIKLIFDLGIYENITTTYTLIREDGHWKIDDIAPKGDPVTKENDGDTVLERSNSIKTDMQKNYNAALAHYNKEQAQQNTTAPASKP